MDLVGPDLAEPASTVSAYKLTGTLESAIRASNAQFDSSDVLDRLRVRMMPHAGAEEKGWDVFSLEYVVDDPLSTVFTEQAMGKYLRVFNFLWRLKRVETDGEKVYISNYFRTAFYEWSRDVERISYSRFFLLKVATLELNGVGSFGRKLYFVTSNSLLETFRKDFPGVLPEEKHKS